MREKEISEIKKHTKIFFLHKYKVNRRESDENTDLINMYHIFHRWSSSSSSDFDDFEIDSTEDLKDTIAK